MARTFDEHWQEIEQWFDWKKVRKAMKALNWTWFYVGGEPKIKDLKHSAKNLLYNSYTKDGYTMTGGFEAYYDKIEDELRLSFILTDWSSYEQ